MSRHVMFSHERLIAYQRAIAFVAWSQAVEEDILDGKRILSEIVGLVPGLLNKLQTRIADRIGECAEQYLSVPCDSFPSPDQPASASD